MTPDDISPMGADIVRARPSEEWRPIAGFEGCYEVSSFGRIRTARGQVRSLCKDKDGYLRVTLRRNGARTTAQVHRLVCRAFHGEAPAGKPHAAHLNGDRADARADNLAWASPAENCAHRIAHGTNGVGERHPSARLTAANVRAIKASPGRSAAALGSEYGVSETAIRDIRNGRRWGHISPSAAERSAIYSALVGLPYSNRSEQ